MKNKVAQGYIGFEEDEIKGKGDLDNSLKNMINELKIIISNIAQAAGNVAAGSEQISNSAQNLSQSANEHLAEAGATKIWFSTERGNIDRQIKYMKMFADEIRPRFQ